MLKPQIFISYAHEDTLSGNFIRMLVSELPKYNIKANSDQPFSAWTDQSLIGGDEWQEEIDHAITDSFALVVLVTSKASNSLYVTYEWSRALGLERVVIPVMLEDVKKMHEKLKTRQWQSHPDKNWSEMIKNLISSLEIKYEELRKNEKREESQRVAQLVYSELNHGRKQREIGDLRNALPSLLGAEKNIVDFETVHGKISSAIDQDNSLISVVDDVYYELGQTYYLMKNEVEAAKYFKLALDYNSDHVYSHISLGNLARKKADDAYGTTNAQQYLDEARYRFEKALELQESILDQEGQSLWASLGGIYKRENSIKTAIELYEKAIEYKKSSYPFNNLGLLYFQQKNIDEMVANFRVSLAFSRAQLAVKPDDRWSYSDWLIAQLILNKSGRKDEKIDDDKTEHLIDHVMRVSPSDVLRRLNSILNEIIKRNEEQKLANIISDDVIDIQAAESALRKIQAKVK